MSKEIYISSTPHETRLAIVEKDELSEIYYERENEYTLAGSIYNGRVTRVLPGMQSAFVDLGLERDAFLYITDFMEEQEDSAEFESGEPRRNTENGGERNERRRGDRDRGGRSREEPREASNESAPVQEQVFASPEAADIVAEPGAEAGEDTGEGSRRWRGRRGRRRGRGGEGRSAGAPGEAVLTGQQAAPPVDDEAAEPLDRVYGEAQEPEIHVPREARVREDRGRDRGGRQRERFGERGRRSEQPEASSGEPSASGGEPPLILPGESLSKYRRGEAGDAAAQTSASMRVNPTASLVTARPSTEFSLSTAGWNGGAVLPGESLSRRRQNPAEVAAPEQPRQRSSSLESAESDASSDPTGRNRRRERDRRRGKSTSEEQPQRSTAEAEEETPTSFRSGVSNRAPLDPMEAAQPAVTSQHEPEASSLPFSGGVAEPVGDIDRARGFDLEAFERSHSAEAMAVELEYVPETDAAPMPEGASEVVLEAVAALHNAGGETVEPAVEDFHEETTEYEPGEDASASYRVDPAGPSEFRQAGTVDEDDVEGGDPAVQADYAGTEHQYTTIQNTGEMLSELPGEVAVPGAGEDPTNPIEHETAVLSQRASELLGEDAHAQPTAEEASAESAESAAQAFAPGTGDLEEEYLDEDETEVLDLAASYGDDTEEETFEAGAEIGSLVRDRALEQMTQGGPELLDEDEDEDDFDIDEEEMEEDELDGSEEIAGSDISEAQEDEAAVFETAGFDEEDEKPSAAAMGEFPEFQESSERRERGSDRGEGRQEPKRDQRRSGGGRERGGRDRRGMANSRSNGRQSRHSMQTTDLPAISDLLKPGQEVLVQIAKEPIAKKGARITSHIALPGRFLVFMPTVNHVGVSRKIESDGERRRLKEILLSEKGEASGGFIVRTAASGASEEELRSDLRFLLNLWADIKQRSESSKSPALIYHDLNLVERILRDQVTDNFSAIWVDTEDSYERVLRFLQRFQPSLMRRVKLYSKDTPLFEQFGISEEINKALRSKVWLKSGGSIVINQTEALVAIDINTGKYVGKTARLEDTIVKTNLDAIPEIVRQIRLRDLGGIIVIDFIDMDDRKNRQKVLTALEEELKKDRAPSKVLQFNDFGLVAITRKRVKQSLERTLSTTCNICAGTGMVKSPVTVCNEIYIELRKMHKQLDKGDVMLRVNPEVVKHLKANNAKWLLEMEEISGKTILVKSDPSLHPEQFDIH